MNGSPRTVRVLRERIWVDLKLPAQGVDKADKADRENGM